MSFLNLTFGLQFQYRWLQRTVIFIVGKSMEISPVCNLQKSPITETVICKGTGLANCNYWSIRITVGTTQNCWTGLLSTDETSREVFTVRSGDRSVGGVWLYFVCLRSLMWWGDCYHWFPPVTWRDHLLPLAGPRLSPLLTVSWDLRKRAPVVPPEDRVITTRLTNIPTQSFLFDCSSGPSVKVIWYDCERLEAIS